VKPGISVKMSQILTVLSPPPVARDFPSGEKVTERMASACPSRVAEALVTGLTLN